MKACCSNTCFVHGKAYVGPFGGLGQAKHNCNQMFYIYIFLICGGIQRENK